MKDNSLRLNDLFVHYTLYCLLVIIWFIWFNTSALSLSPYVLTILPSHPVLTYLKPVLFLRCHFPVFSCFPQTVVYLVELPRVLGTVT